MVQVYNVKYQKKKKGIKCNQKEKEKERDENINFNFP